jgi:4-hydroxybenzoate polyprenyltransferase
VNAAYLLPYLRLVRAPAVFSALGDPLQGMLIAGGRLRPGTATGVAGAAAAVYLAGMALNDYADREEDARERPDRPIPSGAVPEREAALLGGALLVQGWLAARRAGAGLTGTALVAAVLAYDFALKSTPAGPVAMGACRALSLLMGAQAAGGMRGVARAAGAATLLGGYVAGLTLLARGETEAEGNGSALPGVLVAGAALLVVLAVGGRRALPWVAATAREGGRVDDPRHPRPGRGARRPARPRPGRGARRPPARPGPLGPPPDPDQLSPPGPEPRHSERSDLPRGSRRPCRSLAPLGMTGRSSRHHSSYRRYQS